MHQRGQAEAAKEDRTAGAAFRSGETSVARLRRLVVKTIASAALARVDYVDVLDADTLGEIKTVGKNCVFALAVFFGKTRLIDNLWLK